MPKQNIQNILISELRLWTENPRDPVDPKKSDSEIILHALRENPKDWSLNKLLSQMGDYYDFSELPTVVYLGSIPVVFDGNRRVAIIKCLQDPALFATVAGKLFPDKAPDEMVTLKEIPCNVCDKETALTNIERKHATSGSWNVLQKEYFSHVHRGKPKSLFLTLEEQFSLITKYPVFNQRFIRDEVLTRKNLKDIGFGFEKGKCVSILTNEQQEDLFNKVASLIKVGSISTRSNRGTLRQALLTQYPELEKDILPTMKAEPTSDAFNSKTPKPITLFPSETEQVSPTVAGSGTQPPVLRRTATTTPPEQIFGRKLVLQSGPVNNLYRAIEEVYEKFQDKEYVMPMIGMSLRLILDVAGQLHLPKIGKSPTGREDQAWGILLKEAKKDLKDKFSIDKKNATALTLDWISDKYNLTAIVGKYAHGTIPYTKETIIQASVIAGDILQHYFGRK